MSCVFCLSSSKTKKMAGALEKSRFVVDAIGRARGLVDDAQSTLLVDLAKIVADNAAKEGEATAAARRDWWTEARESLRHVFAVAHNGCTQSSRGVSTPRCNEDNGSACSDDVDVGVSSTETKPPLPSAAAQLLLVRIRLDELLLADEARVADNIATDITAADTNDGRGDDRGGPLDLAVAENQRCCSEAIQRCADAMEAFRSAPSASRGENTSDTTASPAVKKNSTGGSTVSASGIISHRGGKRNAEEEGEEEFESFRLRLEAKAVQLATSSFGAEVRQLAVNPSAPAQAAVTEAMDISEKPSSSSSSPSSSSSSSSLASDYCPRKDLTRSQLDLRRTARVRAFARALGEMISRGHRALLDDNLRVSLADCGRHRYKQSGWSY